MAPASNRWMKGHGQATRQEKLFSNWPVDWDHAGEHECHPNFTFDIAQVIGNPPRCLGRPIEQRWMTRHKVPIKPDHHAGQ